MIHDQLSGAKNSRNEARAAAQAAQLASRARCSLSSAREVFGSTSIASATRCLSSSFKPCEMRSRSALSRREKDRLVDGLLHRILVILQPSLDGGFPDTFAAYEDIDASTFNRQLMPVKASLSASSAAAAAAAATSAGGKKGRGKGKAAAKGGRGKGKGPARGPRTGCARK